MEVLEILEMIYFGVIQEVILFIVYFEDFYIFFYKKNNNYVYFLVGLQYKIMEMV